MTSFGEISEPSSRSTWEDWDDEIADTNGIMLQWNRPLVIPDKIEALFILEGKYLSDCVKLQHNDSCNNLQLINLALEANLNLFQIVSTNRYICTVRDYKLLQSSEIVELLKPFLIKSSDVLTIQTKPLTEYQTNNISTVPLVLKKLNTSSTNNSKPTWNLNFPKLEQPNILCGVNAGVISLREHLNLSASALVYYIEHGEEYETDEIQKLLAHLEIVKSCNTHPNSILNSNLYI